MWGEGGIIRKLTELIKPEFRGRGGLALGEVIQNACEELHEKPKKQL